MDSTTGFMATLHVNDGASNAYVKFAGAVTITLPSQETGEIEETELDQQTAGESPVSDPVRRYSPTGLIEMGTLKCEIKYSRANYTRLLSLVGKKGKSWRLTAPDEDGSGATVALQGAGKGFVKKVEEINFEKETPLRIKFEVRTSEAWTFGDPA